MVNKMSSNVADYFLKNNLIQKKEADIYIYGLQLIISSVFGISTILFCGLMLKRLIDSIIFLLCFIILRQYSGGYHANSYLKCNLYFISTFLITEAAIVFTQTNYEKFLSIGMFCTSFIILFKFAPVDNKNKKLNKSQKYKNKRISLVTFIILIVIAVLLKSNNNDYYYNVSVTVFCVTSLMMIQIIKEYRFKTK